MLASLLAPGSAGLQVASCCAVNATSFADSPGFCSFLQTSEVSPRMRFRNRRIETRPKILAEEGKEETLRVPSFVYELKSKGGQVAVSCLGGATWTGILALQRCGCQSMAGCSHWSRSLTSVARPLPLLFPAHPFFSSSSLVLHTRVQVMGAVAVSSECASTSAHSAELLWFSVSWYLITVLVFELVSHPAPPELSNTSRRNAAPHGNSALASLCRIVCFSGCSVELLQKREDKLTWASRLAGPLRQMYYSRQRQFFNTEIAKCMNTGIMAP